MLTGWTTTDRVSPFELREEAEFRIPDADEPEQPPPE